MMAPGGFLYLLEPSGSRVPRREILSFVKKSYKKKKGELP
jgi:hypothetical protein